MIITPSTDANQRQEWNLDGVGNWDETSITDQEGMVDVEDREHSSVNELIRREDSVNEDLRYDDNGNLVEDSKYLYEWDSRNRLRRATRKDTGEPGVEFGVVGVYSYDAMDRRIRREVDNSGSLNGTTDYYYDGNQVVEERDGSNVLTQQYVYGNYIDEVLIMDRNLDGDDSAIGTGDQRFHYHQDALFSVYAVTDESGEILESYLYDSYGNVTVFDQNGDPVPPNNWGTAHSAISNPYLFTGRRFDEETGLYYFRARYFDSEQGRFISRDPLGYVDGMNLYEYVSSNPIIKKDPYGTQNDYYHHPDEGCEWRDVSYPTSNPPGQFIIVTECKEELEEGCKESSNNEKECAQSKIEIPPLPGPRGIEPGETYHSCRCVCIEKKDEKPELPKAEPDE